MVGNARGRGARATHSPSSRKLLAVNSAEDSDFLYYPDDEDIPVALCKYVYGYPRDFHERYEVLEELGKGSFGVVHRVVDRETGEFYAAKTLPKSRPTWTGGMDGGMREATTSTYLLKIQSEVNFLARLSDVEEVVRLEKACEDDTHVHLVMDLCEGGSLRQRMESAGKGGARRTGPGSRRRG
ncbi:protein kinase [Chloropicon primus]|uniref:Protein kinase n=1 Tax=Chloropicon primus TaxID=1764295 RepID=A0A5B8MLL5_9CHLO|nr:protein kinase [Chloropicon primus]|eukprot:QDZ20240.1 protein kinase [Chloropicon primus]